MQWVSRRIAVVDGPGGDRIPGASLVILASLMRRLSSDLRRAVRMAVLQRSSLRVGARLQGQIDAASVAGLSELHHDQGGSVTLWFTPLGSAMPDLYRQGEFWPARPAPESTAFDLLADAIADVQHRAVDSDRLDRPFLQSLVSYGEDLASDDIAALEFVVREQDSIVRLDNGTVRSAAELNARMPLSQAVRLEGVLESIRLGGRCFGLRLLTGELLPCLFIGSRRTVVRQLLPGQRVAIGGRVHWKPSQDVLRIDARAIAPIEQVNSVFSQLPVALTPGPSPEIVMQRQARRAARLLLGILPRDEYAETEDEFWAAVEELS